MRGDEFQKELSLLQCCKILPVAKSRREHSVYLIILAAQASYQFNLMSAK